MMTTTTAPTAYTVHRMLLPLPWVLSERVRVWVLSGDETEEVGITMVMVCMSIRSV